MIKPAQKDISVFFPYILVEPVEDQKEKTPINGVYLPPEEEKILRVRVVVSSISSNKSNIIPPLRKGDIIYVKRFISYTIPGSKCRFVSEDDVMGKE